MGGQVTNGVTPVHVIPMQLVMNQVEKMLKEKLICKEQLLEDRSKCAICDSPEVVISGVRSDGDTKISLCQKCRFRVDDALRNHIEKHHHRGPYVIRPVGDGDFVLIPVGGGEVK